MVIRVDREKRYIDLSKKKVLAADFASTEMNFKKSKMVHNILKQMVVKMNHHKKEKEKESETLETLETPETPECTLE